MAGPAELTLAPLLGEPLPIELMNTVWADRDGVHDALATDDETLGWLRAVGDRLPVDPPAFAGWADAARPPALAATAAGLRSLRDALRRLAADATQDTRAAAGSPVSDRSTAVTALNEAAGSAPLSAALSWPSSDVVTSHVRTSGPVGPALVAVIAEESVQMFVGDVRAQMRACQAPGCVLYFAKEHGRREWCSAGCGNRARAARHYQRTRSARG